MLENSAPKKQPDSKQQKRNHRPPVGGWDTKSDRIVTSITLPEHVARWVRGRYENISMWLRDMIMLEHQVETRKK